MKEGVQGMALRQGGHPCVSFSARNAVFPFLGRKDTSPGRTPCRRSVTVRCIHPGCRAGAVEERSHPPGRTLPPGEYAHRRKTETENPVSWCPIRRAGIVRASGRKAECRFFFCVFQRKRVLKHVRPGTGAYMRGGSKGGAGRLPGAGAH